MDDLKAIRRLKRGDLGGLDALIERYQVRAVRTAYLITQDVALAEDVVQTTFVNVYRTIRNFDDRRPFAPWFMRSVVNGAIKAVRRIQGYTSLDDEGDESTLIDPEASIDEKLEMADLEQQVWEALASLSPEHRGVIALRYYCDMSEAEIAEQLEIPIGTVKSRLYTAKKRMRALLVQDVER